MQKTVSCERSAAPRWLMTATDPPCTAKTARVEIRVRVKWYQKIRTHPTNDGRSVGECVRALATNQKMSLSASRKYDHYHHPQATLRVPHRN